MKDDEKKKYILAITDELEHTALESAASEVRNIREETGVNVDLKAVGEKIHAWAVNYATKLVGQLDETTRMSIDKLQKQFENKEITDAEFADGLAQIFSAARADMVSVTETTAAISKGAVLAFETGGNVSAVAWLTQDDDLVCEICIANESIGAVPMGTLFPSGHTEPPAHPNDRCSLIPIYR